MIPASCRLASRWQIANHVCHLGRVPSPLGPRSPTSSRGHSQVVEGSSQAEERQTANSELPDPFSFVPLLHSLGMPSNLLEGTDQGFHLSMRFYVQQMQISCHSWGWTNLKAAACGSNLGVHSVTCWQSFIFHLLRPDMWSCKHENTEPLISGHPVSSGEWDIRIILLTKCLASLWAWTALYEHGQVLLSLNLGPSICKIEGQCLFSQWLRSLGEQIAGKGYKLQTLCHRWAHDSPQDKSD